VSPPHREHGSNDNNANSNNNNSNNNKSSCDEETKEEEANRKPVAVKVEAVDELNTSTNETTGKQEGMLMLSCWHSIFIGC